MDIRNFLDGNESHIAELFELSFGRQLSLDFWRWRFREDPFGGSVIMLMFDGEVLVGHYAVIKLPLLIDGEEIQAAFSMTTMTHPRYRGRGIFPKLARAGYAECQKEGIQLVFGFPNENSYVTFLEKIGWLGLGKVPAWLFDNAGMIYCEHNPSNAYHNAEEVRQFGEEFDGLWKAARPNCRFVVPRTSKFLNWRYLQKPGNEYHVVAFYSQEKYIEGYAVYKIYIADDEKRGHIIDFLYKPGKNVEEAILGYGIEYFGKEGVDNISCWIPDVCNMSDLLLEKGFRKIEWPCYFGMKYLETYKGKRDIGGFEDLYITMGDSDVF